MSHSNPTLLEEGFRWFGAGDPGPLAYIRQAGATGVFSALRFNLMHSQRVKGPGQASLGRSEERAQAQVTCPNIEKRQQRVRAAAH
jgi:D-mannonate dehydratase